MLGFLIDQVFSLTLRALLWWHPGSVRVFYWAMRRLNN
jgi:hypothetical protein